MFASEQGYMSKSNLVVLIGLVIVAVLLYRTTQQSNDEFADDELEQVVEQVETFYEAVDVVAEDPAAETPEFKPALSGGSMGAISNILAESMNANLELQKQYVSTLDSIGWMTLLSPEHLAADETFAASTQIIGLARDVVAEFRARAEAQTESVRAQVRQVEMPAAEREAFMQEFETSLAQSIALRDRSWDYETEALDEVTRLAVYLHENRGRWTVDARQFVFDGQDALDTFNAHVARVNAIVDKQQQLQQDHIRFVRERVDAAK